MPTGVYKHKPRGSYAKSRQTMGRLNNIDAAEVAEKINQTQKPEYPSPWVKLSDIAAEGDSKYSRIRELEAEIADLKHQLEVYKNLVLEGIVTILRLRIGDPNWQDADVEDFKQPSHTVPDAGA